MSTIPVAVVTGHHNFDVPGFQRLLNSMPEIDFYLQDLDNFVSDEGGFNKNYQAVIFYNFHQLVPSANDPRDAKLIQTINQITENGQGLLVLHHAILAFPEWDVWNQSVGIPNRNFEYANDQIVQTDIITQGHPITTGLQGWQMVDEIYGMNDVSRNSNIILTTTHPKSMQFLAWTRQYKNSRVFCYQSGHDDRAFSDMNFRQVISQGLDWLVT